MLQWWMYCEFWIQGRFPLITCLSSREAMNLQTYYTNSFLFWSPFPCVCTCLNSPWLWSVACLHQAPQLFQGSVWEQDHILGLGSSSWMTRERNLSFSLFLSYALRHFRASIDWNQRCLVLLREVPLNPWFWSASLKLSDLVKHPLARRVPWEGHCTGIQVESSNFKPQMFLKTNFPDMNNSIIETTRHESSWYTLKEFRQVHNPFNQLDSVD